LGGGELILLDTHIWVWWASDHPRLSQREHELIHENAEGGLGVSIISCWEIAKLVKLGRLELNMDVRSWLECARSLPGVQLVAMNLDIVLEANSLPGSFHRDPADQIIVASARILDCALLTQDSRIRNYPHVVTL